MAADGSYYLFKVFLGVFSLALIGSYLLLRSNFNAIREIWMKIVRATPLKALMIAGILAALYVAVVFIPPPFAPFPFRYQMHVDRGAVILDTWTGRVWFRDASGVKEL